MAECVISEKDIQAEWFLLRVGNFRKCVLIPLDKNEIIVGRSSNKHLKDSPGVSRKHARFQKTDEGGWVIQDLKSTNGIYVNNVKINSEHSYNIQESDIIGLGIPSATSEEHFLFKLCRNPNYLSQKIKTEPNISDEYLSHLKLSVDSDNYVNYSVPNENDSKDRLCRKKEKVEDAEEDVPDRTLQLRNCIVPLKRCDDLNLGKVKEKIDNENYVCLSSPDSEDQDLLQTAKISRLVKARKRRILSSDDSESDFSPNHRVKKYLSEIYPKKTSQVNTNVTDPIEHNRTVTKLKGESSDIKETSCLIDVKCETENTDTKESFCHFDLKKKNKELQVSKNIKQEKLSSNVIIIDDDSPLDSNTKRKQEISEFDDSVVIINENSGYSQNDDIIIISDDDDAGSEELNIKIKQEDGLIKNIKTENLAEAEPFDNGCDEDSNNYFEDELNSSKEDFPCDTVDDNLPDLDDDDDKNVNEEELLNRICWPPLSEDPEEETKEDKIPEEEFFPVLSQSFYSDDESTSSSSSSSESDRCLSEQREKKISSDIKSDKSKPNTNQSVIRGNKSCGIQITEALPMQRRPRYARGREEWFMERNTSERLSIEDEFLSKKSADKFYRSNLPVKKSRSVSTSKKEKKHTSLKEKLKGNMGYRLRFPGGGSAIRTTGEINDIRIINNNQTNVSTAKKIEQENVISSNNRDCVSNNDLVGKKKSVMPTRIFESRSSKLTKDLLDNVNVSRKKCETNTTEKGNSKYKNSLKNYKIPRKISVSESAPSKERKGHVFNGSPTKRNEANHFHKERESAKILENCKVTGDTELSHKTKKVRFSDTVENENKSPVNTSRRSSIIKSKEKEKFVDTNSPNDSADNCLMTIENVIAKIVQWKVTWLSEQKNIANPPPVVEETSLRKVTLYYNSKREYFNTYFNLLLLEIWNCMFRSWKTRTERSTYKSTLVSVTSYNIFKDMMILNCQAVVSLTLPLDKLAHPFEGNVIIMDLRISDMEKAIVRVFGYISDHKSERFRPQANHLLANVPACKEENPQLITFVVKTKLREQSLDLSKLMKIQGVLYIRPLLRHCEALINFSDSSLHPCILKPDPRICSFNNSSQVALRPLGDYNVSQKQAITGIARSICQQYSVPRILLLHGPPGTGKTHTIIGIIRQLLCRRVGEQYVKLLVAAPSNAAVDEIGRRLLKYKSNLKFHDGRKIRFVRIGQSEQVHKELKFYFIEELVKYNLKETQKDSDLQISINDVEAKINRLQLEIQSKKERKHPEVEIKVKEAQLQKWYQRLESCRNRNDSFGNVEKFKQKLRNEILTKADVILTTLNSCRSAMVESAFGKNSNVTFTCCIVDEASQCTEPEILIPLQYGISKLVLVGDPQQLPALVTSKTAAQCGFQMSLFERFHRYFLQLKEPNPVFMLTEQYRMHSEICQFPSLHFYGARLKTSGNHFQFPVKPYVLLDIVDSQECKDNPSNIFNMPEASFVSNLCLELLKVLPASISLGIITPYQGQKHLFNQYLESSQQKVEVNTVDGFQGREKDVIILSCVRGNNFSGNIGFLNDGQRLNVAITRARHSLIICGHVAFLRNHAHWNALIANAERRNLLFPVKSSAVTEVIKMITN